MHTKKKLIRKGIGWGNLPKSDILEEYAQGTLVEIRPQSWQNLSLNIPMVAVHKKTIPISDRARAAIEWFRSILNEELEPSLE